MPTPLPESWRLFRQLAGHIRAIAETSRPILMQGTSTLAVPAFAYTILGMPTGTPPASNDNEPARGSRP